MVDEKTKNVLKLAGAVALLVVAGVLLASRARGPVFDEAVLSDDEALLMELDSRLESEWDELTPAERRELQERIEELDRKLGFID